MEPLKIDPDGTIKFISIPKSELRADTLTFIQARLRPDYADVDTLAEHLYGVEVIESAADELYTDGKNGQKEAYHIALDLQAVHETMGMYEAGYVRFI